MELGPCKLRRIKVTHKKTNFKMRVVVVLRREAGARATVENIRGMGATMWLV